MTPNGSDRQVAVTIAIEALRLPELVAVWTGDIPPSTGSPFGWEGIPDRFRRTIADAIRSFEYIASRSLEKQFPDYEFQVTVDDNASVRVAVGPDNHPSISEAIDAGMNGWVSRVHTQFERVQAIGENGVLRTWTDEDYDQHESGWSCRFFSVRPAQAPTAQTPDIVGE